MFSYAIWRSPLLGAETVFNDLQGKESARIATVYGQTAFNQGYLLNSKKLHRGKGFEATTQAWGTLRAAKGLFFSADAAAGTDTPHLDMPAATQQLKDAQQRATALADANSQANADPADRATQAALVDGLSQLREPGLLASAPGGMAFVTPKSVQHSAGENVIVTAGEHMDVSITKRLRMAVGELISLCAHTLGLEFIASKGKVRIEAHSDEMALTALKDVTVTSTEGRLVLAAKKEVWIGAGGSYIKINGSQIENGTMGAILERGASWDRPGPASMQPELPLLPKSVCIPCLLSEFSQGALLGTK
jgi:type VI secretion system secreted protein VgrG